MNKLFKGAIAGAAGVALLLGGAGTFALWNDVLDFSEGKSIQSGQLKFAVDDMDPAAWALNGVPIVDTAADPDDTPDNEIDAIHIVPGDTLTMSWNDVGVIVTGDYLVARIGVELDEFAAQLLPESTLHQFYTALDPTIKVWLDNDKVEDPENYYTYEDEVHLTEGEHLLTVEASVFFQQNAVNDLMNKSISLDGLGLTVRQVPHPDAHPDYVEPED